MNETFLPQVYGLAEELDRRGGGGDAAVRVARAVFGPSSLEDGRNRLHDTRASTRVAKLVATPATARKLLEIYAIDYVELGLAPPPFLAKLPAPALSADERRYL
mmetsp:Transcript_3079/g.9190  ORF Transcript_3079/g.9190 Transcript_3079/m.9190 type:complete len:104 (-) Transcript_3079:932-1243(-)